ncbi:MAG TPA: VTT domain-containing protein [Candidatus Saccharimonadales bacterium]
MIPGFDLITFITLFGVLGVAAIVFAESGLLIGFFLPGDSLLFTAGLLAHQGVLDINIHLLVAILFVAAALGDSVGYAFGKRVGPRLFNRPNSKLFKQENVEKASIFYEKHGAKAIVLARFIPVVRTFAPIIAGISKMNYKHFLAFNLIGAALWAVGLTYLGYYAGAWFEAQGLEVDHYLLPIIALIILLSVLPPIIHLLKDPVQRKSLSASAKRVLKRK